MAASTQWALKLVETLLIVDSVVVLYTGDGKGKSSSAFGVMSRGWARGWRVGVVQFIKSADWKTGEKKLADHLGIEWHIMGDGFTWESTDLNQSAQHARGAWDQAKQMLSSGDYQLLILDEITYPVTFGWLDVNDVVAAIKNRPDTLNVVITGRDAPSELIELADTVTEMRKIKHAFDSGKLAKKGVDY